MKVGVVGSRTFSNYSLLSEVLDDISDIQCVVSGGAKGADSLAARYAKEHSIELIEFLPQWKKHGKIAGIIRNREIVSSSDIIIAFWDGKSRGTQHTIELARKQGKKVHVIMF